MTVQDERRQLMRRKRSAADQQIADLLVTAKKSLDLSVAFLSRMDGTTQHLEVVETSVPVLVQEGAKVPQDTSFCQAISDGRLYGTFCAFGFRSDKELGKRDEALMKVLASAAAVIVEPQVRDQQRRTEIEGRLDPVVADGGPLVLLQPIVDLATGSRVGAEALSRFPAEWGLAPDVVFAEAHSIGLGHQLELLALEAAAVHLDRVG